MSKVLIIGGTGYAGSAIAAEASQRGHQVTAVSRTVPAAPLEAVTYTQVAVPDETADLIADADAVVLALSPRGDTAGQVRSAYAAIAEQAAARNTPLYIVGGFSSLRPSPGEPRFIENAEESPYLAEAQEMDSVRAWLQSDEAPDGLKWTFFSPGLGFSSMNPGERTGTYRLGGEVALLDDAGESNVSGADYAIAIVDGIDSGEHRGHVGVAY